MTQANNITSLEPEEIFPVFCPDCLRKIFDGKVIRARAVNVIDQTALCRCKKWVPVPITFQQ